MSEHPSGIILEYIKALVWPLVVVHIAHRYHKYIAAFLDRLNRSASEITISPSGLSAKFSEEIKELTEIKETISALPDEQTDVKQRLDENTLSLIKQRFVTLADKFFNHPIETRQRAAQWVEELAPLLPLASILDYCSSEQPGERVAAGIALGVHLRSHRELQNDAKVRAAFKAGLGDAFSRVRYRFVEALSGLDILISHLASRLKSVADEDENEAVREEAKRVLKSI